MMKIVLVFTKNQYHILQILNVPPTKIKKTLKYKETYSTTRKVKQGSYFKSSRILKEAVTVITCCQRSRLCQTVLKVISTTTVDVDINLHQIEVHAINLIKTSQNLTIKQQFNLG